MWSWHWSPLTQTSLLLSPSDGLASFLETTLANGVKVVEKVITSKFRFHLIAIYALGCFRNFSCTPVLYQNYLEEPPPPQPRETSERMNFNVIDKKQLIWKLFIYWYLMSFFQKKNVTKCLGHHYAIWTSDSNWGEFVMIWFDFWCFNATFNNVSAISWRPVLVVEKNRSTRREPGQATGINFITCGCESCAPFL